MDIINKIKALNTKAVEKFKNDTNYPYSNPGFLFNSWFYRYFQTDVFSKRKTITTINSILYKLTEISKSVQNKKYLQSEVPYYVFPNHITDLEGNVLLMKYAKITPDNNRYTNTLWLITSDFYNSEHPLAIGVKKNFRDYLEVVNTKDIYEMFFKLYEFTSIKDITNFKTFAKNALEEKVKEVVKEREVEELHA